MHEYTPEQLAIVENMDKLVLSFFSHSDVAKSFSRVTFVTECGLNADWWCTAWYFGYPEDANRTSGGLYITDPEDGTLCLVRYYPEEEDPDDMYDTLKSVPIDEWSSLLRFAAEEYSRE